MPASARLGDSFVDAPGVDLIAQGSGNVFVNGIPKARLGDLTTGHTAPGHTFYLPAPIVEGSGNVFVNGIPAARVGDKHGVHCDTPGHPASDCHDAAIDTGSPDVFINGA